MIAKGKCFQIFHQILSTNSSGKYVEISLENLYRVLGLTGLNKNFAKKIIYHKQNRIIAE